MKKQERVSVSESPHVLVVPFPAQGHINPMLQFSKRLVSKGLQVTLVTFSSATKSLGVSAVKLETISDDLGSYDILVEGSIVAYFQRFKEIVTTRLPQIAAKLSRVSCLVYDSTMPWAQDLANQLGIRGAEFFTQSCAVNTIYYNIYHGLLKLPLIAASNSNSAFSILGLPLPLEQHDFPSLVYDLESFPALTDAVVNQLSSFKEADWVFINTFTTLEEEGVKWMDSQRPIMTIGPTLPSKYLDKRVDDDEDYSIQLFKPETDTCITWLNSKQTGSVVYVSFGSVAALGEEQMEELASGLKRSNAYFLWVVRETEQDKLPPNFLEDTREKGLVVSWCPQLEVLSHKAVGCFMTHCGWNSTLEALSLGVPMVALPHWTDQTTNAKFVADVWKTGIRAKRDDKGIIKKEEIERCIREIMEGDKSKVFKENSEKWKTLALEAVNEGGSSDKNIDEFVAKLIACN